MPDLMGVELNGRWIVGERDMKRPGESGRNFCLCYTVTEKGHSEQPYFLKALDFYRPLANSKNIVADLLPLLERFHFEQRVLDACKGSDRVVTAIDSGQYTPPGEKIPIPFLVFELGTGDMNRHLASNAVDFTWKIQAFHHIATAIRYIHGRDIAHQDLKPSNVVVFQKHSSVADFGRASWKGVAGPFDHEVFPGDPSYMPPEFRYGWTVESFERRRFGADVYMLGAMGVFLFTGLHLNVIVEANLADEYKPSRWKEDYQKVLVYYRDAFYRALDDIKARLPANNVSEELTHIFTWLCEPDPMKRGFIRFGKVEPTDYSLDRLVSRLDYLIGESIVLARVAKDNE